MIVKKFDAYGPLYLCVARVLSAQETSMELGVASITSDKPCLTTLVIKVYFNIYIFFLLFWLITEGENIALINVIKNVNFSHSIWYKTILSPTELEPPIIFPSFQQIYMAL